MILPQIDPESLRKECTFKAVRSGGSGGQHVNKVSTKIELTFDIAASLCFTDEQKSLLLEKLSNRIVGDTVLRIVSDAERSQFRNKEDAFQRLTDLLISALQPVKKRKKTRVPKGVQEKRIDEKKKRGAIKRNRKPPDV